MSKKLIALASAMNAEYETGPKFRTEYQYQATRTGREQIFENGGRYFAIQKRKPVTDCGKWEKHPDQFWVVGHGLDLTIWVADPSIKTPA